ncbi:hypothetical protein MSAN_00533500 [Mycena sanguinolenta]|uniref:Uncharacterized protein n=1 Tax=Mycena sanguinolenta TaxID=230812 RepID=A0A8H6ZAB6_9AGAR|nr:hypothetical protein MSAN_00533500 [Mycena sanguinolenta]
MTPSTPQILPTTIAAGKCDPLDPAVSFELFWLPALLAVDVTSTVMTVSFDAELVAVEPPIRVLDPVPSDSIVAALDFDAPIGSVVGTGAMVGAASSSSNLEIHRIVENQQRQVMRLRDQRVRCVAEIVHRKHRDVI